jgi:hypothetical protein
VSAGWYVLGAVLFVIGAFVILVVCCSAKMAGPDTAECDRYPLRSNIGPDAPPIDRDLVLARAAGVDVTEPADSGLAGEVEGYLRDLSPLPPPIVPGREWPVRHGEPAPGRPEGRCIYPRNP